MLSKKFEDIVLRSLSLYTLASYRVNSEESSRMERQFLQLSGAYGGLATLLIFLYFTQIEPEGGGRVLKMF